VPLYVASHLQHAALNEGVPEAEGCSGEHICYWWVQWFVIEPSGAAISRTQLKLLHIVATYKKTNTESVYQDKSLTTYMVLHVSTLHGHLQRENSKRNSTFAKDFSITSFTVITIKQIKTADVQLLFTKSSCFSLHILIDISLSLFAEYLDRRHLTNVRVDLKTCCALWSLPDLRDKFLRTLRLHALSNSYNPPIKSIQLERSRLITSLKRT
jgi:hypothetical protein